MAGAFQTNAFQNSAFQVGDVAVNLTITSTDILHKPIDYALAGDQDMPQGRSLPVRAGRLSRAMVRHTFGE